MKRFVQGLQIRLRKRLAYAYYDGEYWYDACVAVHKKLRTGGY